MPELSESMMPSVDIEAHLKHLRRLTQSTDPDVLANASPRGKACAPAYVKVAHDIADMIDVYRINGFSAGEAVQAIWSDFLDPIASVPVIDTTHD